MNNQSLLASLAADCRRMLVILGILAAKPTVVSVEQSKPVDVPIPPVEPVPPTQTNIEGQWNTPELARHSLRVICDEMGLTFDEKELITACIYQESRFNNNAKGYNKDHTGQIVSTDWGIVQVNDFYHIGKGKYWSSVDQVLNNPDKAVKWMISLYKQGKLNLWVSYTSGAYKQWLHKV